MGLFERIFGKKKSEKLVEQSKIKIPNVDSKELMDDDKFWDIIAQTKSNAKGNYDKQQAELGKALLELEPIEILEFDNRFRTYRGDAYKWELWGAAYIMNGGCSDDSFSDFRGWLISQGKQVFLAAMQNPESIVSLGHDMDNDDWEGFSYVPMTIYQRKMKNEMPFGIQENVEITGEEWTEEGDDLETRFPALWSKWGF